MRILGIGGEPATGKSRLVMALLSCYPTGWTTVEWNQVRGLVNTPKKIFIFGVYDLAKMPFVGTDRLSMNVQPLAEYFLKSMSKCWADYTVIFEGDRLFNGKFLRFCQQNFETRLMVLTASESLKTQRHAGRADEQGETWLRGRKTKVQNLVTEFRIKTYMHDCPADTERLVGLITSEEIWRNNGT